MKKAFTLVELIIVIVIIAILAVTALPRYFAQVENARKSEAYTTLRAIRDAQMAYYAKAGEYTTLAAGGSITVDIDSDGADDVSIAANSPNFIYTSSITCITATKISGAKSYYMNIASGAVSNSACP